MVKNLSFISVVILASTSAFVHGAEPSDTELLSDAIERSIRLLEKTSRTTADQRKCFTCHGQALPILAFAEAKKRGFSIDLKNFKRQLNHTNAHLRRGEKNYLNGKGQGGGVDTAGYALWTLEAGSYDVNETIKAVTHYLITTDPDDGHWHCGSKRPPSETSDFTTTYLAIRAIDYFNPGHPTAKQRLTDTAKWLRDAKPKTTEDMVFHLRSLHFIDPDNDSLKRLAESLVQSQQEDGGWSQKAGMKSDAYATGTALVALVQTNHLTSQSPVYERGLQFLLNHQADDGSWYVKSRSRPFQKYFESAFPYAEDQFISTSATAWSTIALLLSFPEVEPSENAFDP